MKTHALPPVRLALLVALLLTLGASIAGAQANLLTNPGFESPFNAVGGNAMLNVAQGWTPWHIPQSPGDTASQNVQPEYYPSSNTSDSLGVPRIRSGSDGQQFSAFFATFQGGVFQRVTGVQPGTQLRFSIFAHVWSSSFDDPDLSDEDGGVLVQVGIDPTGGEDGESTSIIWSSATQLYDAFNEYSVTANASGSAVSVWVRASISFPVKNTVVYLDDASLVNAGAPVATTRPPASATPVPATVTTVANVPTNTAAPPTSTQMIAPTFTAAPATSTPAPQQPTNTTAPSQPTNTTAPAQPSSTPEQINTAVPPTVQAPVASATPVPVQPSNTAVPINPGEFPSSIVHTVQRGDTVGRLANLYGSTVQAITTANGLNEDALIFVGQNLVIPVRLPAPATLTPTPTAQVVVVTATPAPATTQTPQVQPPVGGTTTYVVQRGDTLRRIAQQFNTTVAALAQLNGIANVNLIFVGQQLTVPTPGQTLPETYRVQPGDNLFRIALRFGVSLQALAQANNITNTNLVFVGQVLSIPR
jgi:LysM repeat protein